MSAQRGQYEAAVRALRAEALRLRASGLDDEAVARQLVARRNALKVEFRKLDSSTAVRLMEARNLAKYGDAVGPSANWLFDRYGSWAAVIEAACRPASLSRQ